jgi:hypothetical protein
MRVLFATTAAAGHFRPLIPFAEACTRAGHDVLMTGQSSVAPAVERAGFAFRPLAEPEAEEVGEFRAGQRGLSAARVAELDDHIGEEHRRVAAAERRGQPGGAGLGIRRLGGLARGGRDRAKMTGALVDCHALQLSRAAARIVSRGGSSPVQIRNDAAPWCTRTSRPSITRAPRRIASVASAVSCGP